jgi:ABC-type glycerol-3-phosphate transport system permease component
VALLGGGILQSAPAPHHAPQGVFAIPPGEIPDGASLRRRNVRSGQKQVLGDLITHGILLVFAILTIYPTLYMLATALKPIGTFAYLGIWPERFTLDNLVMVITETPLARMLLNSMFVATVSTVVTLFLGSLAAYVFSRRRFFASKAMYAFFLVGLMLPAASGIIPLFQIMGRLHLFNNYLGLILPYIAGNIPFCILVMKGYFDTLPRELEDAAIVDGASSFRIYSQIALPLSTPALTAAGIFIALGCWNEFLLALLFMTRNLMRTAPTATVYFLGYYSTVTERVFAALCWIALPALVFYMTMQKQFVKGLTAGAIKG